MTQKKERIKIENELKRRGRIVDTWWDGEPVHRPMTIEEKAKEAGIDPKTLALGIALLGNRNYKPTFPEDKK